jgi:[ribosomal protein S5]-alanine N-acetyltransferase
LGNTGVMGSYRPPSGRARSVVSLRDVAISDLGALEAYWTPEVRRWLPEALSSPDSVRQHLERAISAARIVPRTQFNLVAEVDGRFVGTGRIDVSDRANSSGDIGYALSEDAWGNGYGTQVALQLVDIGFTQLGLHRVWATVHPGNIASIRVLEKAGLRYEGRLRDNLRIPDGWRDSLIYAAIEAEWLET